MVSVIPKDDIIQVIDVDLISINEVLSDDTIRVVSVIPKDDDLISINDDQSGYTNRMVSVIPKYDIIQVIDADLISIRDDQSDDTNRFVISADYLKKLFYFLLYLL